MWFEALTGFREADLDVDAIASRFVLDGDRLTSTANGRTMRYGTFEAPSLGELRQRWTAAQGVSNLAGNLTTREQVADVGALHRDPANAGAAFQVASQFNTLEMVSPDVTPEMGVDRYERDHTQGPACAIACGAGTIYRNHLLPIGGAVGQRADRQLNLLAPMLAGLEVDVEVRNGYALPTLDQLSRLSDRLADADEPTRDRFMAELQVGVQRDTEVTLGDAGHVVTQVYCSALPVAYQPFAAAHWEPFARLVLDAAYEATMAAAFLNAVATGNRRVHFTMLGGGAFGNDTAWILAAIERALRLFTATGLDVVIVSHGRPDRRLGDLLDPAPSWADPLFAPGSPRWGLRGDPHLWRELHGALRRLPRPPDTAELRRTLLVELRRLCGVDVLRSTAEGVPIERYSRSGMSGGFMSPAAWREHLLALLIERFDGTGS